MKDLSDQIERLTGELRSLRLQLQWSTLRDSNDEDPDIALESLLNAGLVERLRMVMDQFSRLLWCYVESAAANTDPDVDFALQSKRLDQVTEMLRLLRPSSPGAEHFEFVANVTQTVDRHLQRQDRGQVARLGRSA